MKYITFTVPCFNSEDYMRRCIDSLLVCGERAEIIIVDDGSTDKTGCIADEYRKNYPDIVKVIHKENGGHGSGVNAGLREAEGLYFKVVDSDDWLEREALEQVLDVLADWEWEGRQVDLLVCNYIYDHLYENRQKVMHYRNVFESGKIQTWGEIGHFYPSQYLIMHALIYRTKVLRDSGIQLPEHTFYVDNIFANQPLPYVRTLCYQDLNLYHYFLGREDQSVNESCLKNRIDQQILVTKIVSTDLDLESARERSPKLERYLTRNISIMMAISSIYLLLIDSAEAWEKREELWNYIKEQDSELYVKLRYQYLSGLTKLPGKAGRLVTVTGYRAARKLYGFC